MKLHLVISRKHKEDLTLVEFGPLEIFLCCVLGFVVVLLFR